MRMEKPLGMRLTIEGCLVESHRVGKGNLEQIVVTRGDDLQDFGKGRRFSGGQLGEAGQPGTMRAEQNLKRPDRPKWDERGEMVVGGQDALFALVLLSDVIRKQGALVLLEVITSAQQVPCQAHWECDRSPRPGYAGAGWTRPSPRLCSRRPAHSE